MTFFQPLKNILDGTRFVIGEEKYIIINFKNLLL